MSEYHSLDRGLYGEPFAMFLEYLDFDDYGYYEGDDEDVKKHLDENGDYSNDIFSITPYCWCMTDGGCDRCHRPNFQYKPTDFRLTWYKYPLRGNDCNREITAEEFLKMINHCSESFYD